MKPVKPGTFVQIPSSNEPLVPLPAVRLQVKTAGVSVSIVGDTAIGGYVINPATAEEQGQDKLHNLFIDVTGPASTFESNTTVTIKPGHYYVLPRNIYTGVWVNSLADNHRFTAVQIVPLSQVGPTQKELDAAYVKGNFPPTGPTGVLKPIHSYLYQEYSDDVDLQAFVHTYNLMMQDIVDTFNGLHLPNYTAYPISGLLLDWVARGVYGMARPAISSGRYLTLGPYNTGQYNTQEYNFWKLLYPEALTIVNDDIFRRILTWHICKQDCKYFSIAWLKKRIMRFLIGEDGKAVNVDQHYQISITFGPNYEVTIRFVLGTAKVTYGALYNDKRFKYNYYKYNECHTKYTAYPPLPNMNIFQEAVASGALELPFQYKFDVVIG